MSINLIIIDDESHIRLFFKTFLMKAGFNVLAEGDNGNCVVELYEKHKPDMVLLDIAMPYKTGTEALKELKLAFPESKVIMLSSLSDMETVEKSIELGASNYIRKDCSSDEIVKIIQNTYE